MIIKRDTNPVVVDHDEFELVLDNNINIQNDISQVANSELSQRNEHQVERYFEETCLISLNFLSILRWTCYVCRGISINNTV